MTRLFRWMPALAVLVALVFASAAPRAHADTLGEDPKTGVLDVKDVVKKAYSVRPGGTLHLDLDRGNLDVETIQDDRVLIVIERIAKADTREEAEEILQRHEYSFDQEGDDVHLRSRFDKDDSFWGRWRGHERLKIRVRVRVPTEYNVEFSSGAGNVSIADVQGTVDGRTGAGNIDVKSVLGIVEVTSGAGNINVEGDLDRVHVETGAGNINLGGVYGAVKATTGAGNISAEILGQPEQASHLRSGAGNVTVRLAADVSVYVDGSASMGTCETDFPLEVEGKWLKRSFSGQVNGGGPELRLSAGVGNVTLKKSY
ncbi:MAG: DUF4097 family beta strand repeat protein [Bacteroidetes bacterium]|jgi:hypothetical protein|nr:DUF4097 family beta strand repeat protein [Bacteroidota bacterium]